MIYSDRIYGKFVITEPVLLELIESRPLQRLKGIDQAGYFEPHFPGVALSRFEHSFGVCLILRKFSAPLGCQIAGLIHDVSHSAFSHCIEYVLEEGRPKTHAHQDNIFKEFVRSSQIPLILRKHLINLNYILNDANFPLKEKDLPELCADRLDYSLRLFSRYLKLPSDEVNYFLEKLAAENDRWFFKTFKGAKKYAQLFLKLNRDYLAGLSATAMFTTVGAYLKTALQKGYILREDLYGTDREVLQKIAPHLKLDSELKILFERMNNRVPFRNDPLSYDAQVFCKSRIVDPLCLWQGNLKRVSEIDDAWTKVIDEELKPKEYFIKFLDS